MAAKVKVVKISRCNQCSANMYQKTGCSLMIRGLYQKDPKAKQCLVSTPCDKHSPLDTEQAWLLKFQGSSSQTFDCQSQTPASSGRLSVAWTMSILRHTRQRKSFSECWKRRIIFHIWLSVCIYKRHWRELKRAKQVNWSQQTEANWSNCGEVLRRGDPIEWKICI